MGLMELPCYKDYSQLSHQSTTQKSVSVVLICAVYILFFHIQIFVFGVLYNGAPHFSCATLHGSGKNEVGLSGFVLSLVLQLVKPSQFIHYLKHIALAPLTLSFLLI